MHFDWTIGVFTIHIHHIPLSLWNDLECWLSYTTGWQASTSPNQDFVWSTECSASTDYGLWVMSGRHQSCCKLIFVMNFWGIISSPIKCSLWAMQSSWFYDHLFYIIIFFYLFYHYYGEAPKLLCQLLPEHLQLDPWLRPYIRSHDMAVLKLERGSLKSSSFHLG